MTRALSFLDRIVFAAIVLLMAAMVIDVTIQVIWRYVFQDPPTWTEEAARYLFAWEIFLGAGLAFGRKAHIVVDAVFMALRGTARRVFVIVGDLIVLAFLLVLLWQGIGMVALTGNTFSTALHLNIGVVYAALPIGAAIGAVFLVANLIRFLGGDEMPAEPTLI
jgi:TRAP-type C4-dicarboxylate transport system permease small subunit